MASTSTTQLRHAARNLSTEWLTAAISLMGRAGALGWYAEGSATPHNTGARCIAVVRAELKRRKGGTMVSGCDLRPGDQIATCAAPGMETFDAPLLSVDTTSGLCVSFTRRDGTRGNVAADERLYVLRGEG